MMFTCKLLTALLLSIAAVFFKSCSLPTADGTETGNPELEAVASAIFRSIDSLDAWEPQKHLVTGTVQLDPRYLYNDLAEVLLSKKTLSSAQIDDSENRDGEVKGHRIITRTDTIVLSKEFIVHDSITIYSDSLDTLLSEAGDTVYFSRNYATVTYINDTVRVYDTTYVTRHDTINNQDQSVDDSGHLIVLEPHVSSSLEALHLDSVGTPVYSFRLSSGELVSYTSPLSPELIIHDSDNLTSLSRQMLDGGVVVTEEYRTADSGAYLFSKRSQYVNRLAILDASYISSAQQRYLTVLFDNGDDFVFSTTSDNSIHSLTLETFENETLTESVRYGVDNQFNPCAVTEIEKMFPQNSAKESIVMRFVLTEGTGETGHLKRSMISVQNSITYRRGDVRGIAFKLIPEQQVAFGEAVVDATVNLTVITSKGQAGRIEGRVDSVSGRVTGVYLFEGKSYALSLHRSGRYNLMEIE